MRLPGRQLVVDVGMHDGSDTSFYLQKGFDVLAVEADPGLVAQVSTRLRRYVEDGRLVIAPVAVGDRVGEAVFHTSGRAGWGSLNVNRAGGAHHVETSAITVPVDTLANILGGRSPYYVKIDIEGADLDCLRQVLALPELPMYVSFECDLTRRADTVDALRALRASGYRRFKLVNQALLSEVVCSYPAREGEYVEAQFTHLMSGPFGEETPGPWLDLERVIARFEAVSRQQAVRAKYSETGKVFGVPVGRFHHHLERIYNAGPVAALRRRSAEARGTTVGGWFDIHAGL